MKTNNELQDYLERLPIELTNKELEELEAKLTTEETREQAIDLICKPGRLQYYHSLFIADNYDPIKNDPFKVLARIAKGNDRAMEQCIDGMWHNLGFARAYAIDALPQITPPDSKKRTINELNNFIHKELDRYENGRSGCIYCLQHAVGALLHMGNEGYQCLSNYLNGNNGYSAPIKEALTFELRLLDKKEKSRIQKKYPQLAA